MSKGRFRLEVFGTILGEGMSFGLSARGDSFNVFPSQQSRNDFLDQAVPDTTTFLNALVTIWGANTSWQGIRVKDYNEDGTLAGTAEKALATPIVGSTAQTLPAYCAIVCTLKTDTPGRTHRGRIYLPATGSSLLDQTTGKLTTSKQTTIRDAVTTYLNALNNSPGIDSLVGGFSVGVQSLVGVGAFTKVSRVRVGNVFDGQRRRGNQQVETFLEGAVS